MPSDSPTAGPRSCPYCGETIVAVARNCPQCDEDLSVAITSVGTVVRSAIIDFPTLPDAGVPGVDGGESGGCSIGAGTPGAGAVGLLLIGLVALPGLRRRTRRSRLERRP